jgi:ABC-type branched-subunit amino acid transport system ATPase component
MSEDRSTQLVLDDIVAGYQGNVIVHGVSLTVPEAGIVAIVGPNGSGKSTLIKSVFGLVHISHGHISLDGQEISSLSPAKHLDRGMGYVPQLPSIFPSMTVQENLEMGLSRNKGRNGHLPDYAFELFPSLEKRRTAKAGTLSGGERRMLEIGRTMLLRPSMILLDEPSVGLSPKLTKHLFEVLVQLRETAGVSLLIVEQNARTALEMCDEAVVLVAGRIAHQGRGMDLLADETVRQSFLGGRPVGSDGASVPGVPAGS